MAFSLPATSADPARLVEYLGDPHRYPVAYQRLIRLGTAAAEAARHGLGHRDPRVRAQCCRLLDHLMDRECIPALVGMLTDPDEEVRVQALHALSCDRCKDGTCRPAAADVLPSAIAVLRDDASARVRQYAAELVGVWAHTSPDAVAALEAATAGDPSPAVRKKASWHAPGGTIYRRTQTAR